MHKLPLRLLTSLQIKSLKGKLVITLALVALATYYICALILCNRKITIPTLLDCHQIDSAKNIEMLCDYAATVPAPWEVH